MKLNAEMKAAIDRDDFDLYYEKNLFFHDVFLRLSGNETLVRIVTLKKRLYDFPRRQGFVKEWEQESIGEHRGSSGSSKAKTRKKRSTLSATSIGPSASRKNTSVGITQKPRRRPGKPGFSPGFRDI